MRLLFLLFWSTSLAAQLLAGADGLQLVGELDGMVLPLAAVNKGRLMLGDGDTLIPATDAVTWRLEGDIRPAVNLFRWSPSYSLANWSGADRDRPADRPFTARVSVAHAAALDSKGQRMKSALLEDWPEGTRSGAAVVVVWLDADKVTHVVVKPAPDTATDNRFRVELAIPLREASGAPGLALWHAGAFVAPAPLFNTSAEMDALAAVVFDDTAALDRALAAGAMPGAIGRNGVSLAHIAAESGSVRTLGALLTRDRGVVRLASAHKLTPLHWAADKGRTEAVQLLLAAKAAKDASHARGGTPLLDAAQSGHREVVEALVAAKADLDAADEAHRSPLSVAIDRGDAGIAAILEKKGARFEADEALQMVLLTQCRLGHTAMVRWMIEHRVRPTAKRHGENALHAAAFTGDPVLADLLIERKVPVDEASDTGVTPLAVACLLGKAEFAARLLAAGAAVNPRDEHSFSPLVRAAQSGSVATVTLLLDHGAGLEVRSREGVTALGIALIMDHRALAENLTARGARVDIADPRIKQLMEAAIRNDLDEIVARALADGWSADTTLSGWPVIRVATMFRATRTRALLEKGGARLDENQPFPLAGSAELDARPRPTALTVPEDPRDARAEFPAASIPVEFVVNGDGKALFARIGGTPDPRLRLDIAKVIPLWRFTPVTRNGIAVATRVTMPVAYPSSDDRTLSPRQVDELPRPLKRATPSYPVSERARGIEARATVQFTVTTTGTVENVRVIETSGEAFAEEAIAAIKQWTFSPALLDGRPVPIELQQPFIFNLSM